MIRRFHIFLASPGDVEEQRKFVRNFFSNYNIQLASAKGIDFLVIDWENHSSCGIGETQNLIEKQTFETHQKSPVLVIGTLDQRIGTRSSTHEFGTEELEKPRPPRNQVVLRQTIDETRVRFPSPAPLIVNDLQPSAVKVQ